MKSIRNIVFVCGNPSFGSALLRCYQPASRINRRRPETARVISRTVARWGEIESLEESLVIFTLTNNEGIEYFTNGSVEFLVRLRERGNAIYGDIVDSFCFKKHNPFFSKNTNFLLNKLDGFIIHNRYTKLLLCAYRDYVNKDFVLIPHNWNERHEEGLPEHAFIDRPCYVGGREGFQADRDRFDGAADIFFDYSDIETPRKYWIHLSYRRSDSLEFNFKPCSKLATAAACGSVLITSRDESVVDIVGATYPFFVECEEDISRVVNKVCCLHTEERKLWARYIGYIREYLSPETTAKRYLQLLDSLNNRKRSANTH